LKSAVTTGNCNREMLINSTRPSRMPYVMAKTHKRGGPTFQTAHTHEKS